MQPYWATHFMLPGQEHPHAQAVGEALETARESVALLIGCEPFEVVFSSGGTEANNMAVLGIAGRQEPGHLLVTALEHDSVLAAANSLSARGWQIETIACDQSGRVDPDEIGARIRDDTRLACVQLANPVLGTLQRVREICDICHNRGVPVHCDATQAFGKIPIDASNLRADTISISGHKFYGPKGTGAIFVRRGLDLCPISFGEPREMGLRPGPENIPGCIGLGAAAALAAKCADDAARKLGELRERFISGTLSTIAPFPEIVAMQAARLPNTIAIEMPAGAKQIQKAARQLAFATPQSGSPPDEMTRVLRAVGRTDSQIARTLRISMGWTTSRDQVDRAVELLADACDGVMAG